jgi:Xaa-Pro aminopeptidase
MRTTIIPDVDFQDRIRRLQLELAAADLDVLITYSSESEAASSRYLADFWPFFDFAGVIVPREGAPALVTGGPESYEFAKQFSRIKDIHIHPLFVESSAPDWVPPVTYEDFAAILKSVCGRLPKRIGVADWNIFPHPIFADLQHAAAGAEIVPADEVLLRTKCIKSEQAMIEALDSVAEGMAEWEIEAGAHMTMRRLGAEGTSYPIWVCSGPNTHQSLCRSTNRRIKSNELVQLTFGARHMGYCGNMCRPFAIDRMPDRARDLMSVALEGVNGALRDIRPGVSAKVVFDNYYKTLAKYGFEEFTLYGPAHGSGSAEVEGLWLGSGSDLIIEPGMLFNVDIWLNDGEYGLRYEDGLVVTSYRREIIEL